MGKSQQKESSNRRKEIRRKAAKKATLRNAPRPDSVKQRMIRDHLDVLQNIETILVAYHRDHPQVDDRFAMGVLTAAKQEKPDENPEVMECLQALRAIRQLRDDISDRVWRDALTAIQQSIRFHSNLKPGTRSYLGYASAFVP